MAAQRKIEIFSAGCTVCEQAIDQVRDAACPSCDIVVLNMRDASVAERAESLGILWSLMARLPIAVRAVGPTWPPFVKPASVNRWPSSDDGNE